MRALQTGAPIGNSGARASEFPVLRITNRHVSAQICLPDTECGYYRGTRFDWSGIVRDLRSRGHRYVSEWQSRHDPLRHDGLTGPADEFTQIGYEQARPGEEFLKIGVGTLRKPYDQPYDRFRLYEIVDPGIRDLIAGRDRVEFRHRMLNDDYGYDYRKTLVLTDAPGLRLEYTLKNLGPAPLTGYVYNHNFFTLDRMATGPDTSIHFPFEPEGTWREAYDSVALTPDGVVFRRNLRTGESVFMGDLHSQDPATREYGFSLRNLATGAGIQASGSGQLSHMVLWVCPTVACLEPYTPFRVFPGETGVWHIDYELLA
ncbi:hypothetical protein KG007_12705 [Alistipes sp. kh20]|uniref:hypothetical protein n=1 Tax=Alistipes montrealensis TaxID=2834113 RepID=UPI001BCFCF44|nr:hypothetical protein [Alistipes montrealensis]MBS4767056.1 hypothetical protein [Alistipes montrealensis]